MKKEKYDKEARKVISGLCKLIEKADLLNGEKWQVIITPIDNGWMVETKGGESREFSVTYDEKIDEDKQDAEASQRLFWAIKEELALYYSDNKPWNCVINLEKDGKIVKEQ